MKRLLLLLLLAFPLYAQNFGQVQNPLASTLYTSSSNCLSTQESCVWQRLPNNAYTTTVNVTGTFVATLTIEESNNGGVVWTTAGTVTTTGTTTYQTNGFTDLRVRCSAYTSGSMAVTITTGSSITTTGSGSSSPSTATNTITVSPLCGTTTSTCFQANADGRLACGVSYANSSSSVTTASGDPIFVQADVGAKMYSSNQPCNNAIGTVGIILIPLGTILTVTGNHTATVSTTSTNSCAAGQCSFIWGHDDTTALQNAWTAATGTGTSCRLMNISQGGYIISGLIQNLSSGCQTAGGFASGLIYAPGVQGVSTSSTTLYPLPNIDYTNATLANGGGFFGVPNDSSKYLANFGLYGGNTPCTNATNAVAFYGNYVSYFQNLSIQQWCVGTPASIAIDLNGVGNATTTGVNLTSYAVGAPCYFGHYTTIYGALCMGSGTSGVGTGGGAGIPTQTYGVQFIGLGSANNTVNCGANIDWYSFGDFFQASSNVTAGVVAQSCNLWMDGDEVLNPSAGPGGYGFYMNQAGTVAHAKNTRFTASSSTSVNVGNGIFYDDGGNIFTGTIAVASPGLWNGKGNGDTLRAACTGTATSSVTLGLYGTGPNETLTTCTSATIGSGIVMTNSGTVRMLLVSDTHVGVNASSGVVTVLKNGSTQAMTCTLGTSLSCINQTNTFAVVQGDLISVQFTTQAAEVLAGVNAQIMVN
jgi:hypothetical protein